MVINTDKSVKTLVDILKIEDEFKEEGWKKYERYLRNDIYLGEKSKEIDDLVDHNLKRVLFIRTNSPFLAGKGTTQIVLRLDDKTLAKSQKSSRNNFNDQGSHYMINHVSYGPGRIETERILRKLGLNVPEHIYLSHTQADKFNLQISEDDENNFFLLTRDLSENGKYRVEDFDKAKLKDIKNGKQLEIEYNKFFNILNNIRWQNGREYILEAQNHVMDSRDISGAIQHLFMLKIDLETNLGELVAEDTDHLDVYKNSKFKI